MSNSQFLMAAHCIDEEKSSLLTICDHALHDHPKDKQKIRCYIIKNSGISVKANTVPSHPT